MYSLLRRLGVWSFLLVFLPDLCAAQATGEQCLAQFKKGRDDFVLDADESVKDGATYLSSPKLTSYKDCVAACCKDSMCNVAFMDKGDEEGLVKSCFLFDCLYKTKYVCRFVRKKGYINYILDSMYESHLQREVPPDDSDLPPVANGGLDLVVQPQDSVTLNGIESKDDKKIIKYEWSLLSPYPYAIIEKTNFEDQIIVSNLTSGVYKFRLTVTDTAGQAASTQVTVLVLSPEQSEHHCMAPKKVGPCRGSFPRWHYNAASEKCEKFTFGGCRENRNNYLSKDECTKACSGTEKLDKTGRGLPLDPSGGEQCGQPCTGGQFKCANDCCIENDLECDGSPQCKDGSDEQNCEELDKNFSILLQIPLDENKVRCTEPPRTGNCRDSFSKWYYNPMKQDCFRFNYGGCQGNENRFDTKEQCMKMCRGVTEKDVFERRFEPRVSESQTGIIAIAALLGLGIFILLCIMVYCMVKRKKKTVQHHRVPVNTIPVSSMEDRDHLVYNSTTKPI
ncbi:kunitz-type protease inhibitor 1a [Boleophthalmus pectinirostris]|uniref:kunitz-type protease inhibitor 1a n=1 Tax=Boleophthalmus pectinirostris TaxID=150288 RepID=UPI000A1C4206|nr:kunitz-type protease inhibitor 1a [Boleophthalmus pectinirostris]